jgi:hypothetical protein
MGSTDLIKLSALKLKMASALKMSENEFENLYRKALDKVELSIKQGAPLKYFKGKWFRHIMQHHLEALPKIPDASINGVSEKLCIALVGQVAEKQNCCCSAYYVSSFHKALDEVK